MILKDPDWESRQLVGNFTIKKSPTGSALGLVGRHFRLPRPKIFRPANPSSLFADGRSCHKSLKRSHGLTSPRGSLFGLSNDLPYYTRQLGRLIDHDEVTAVGNAVLWNGLKVHKHIRVGTVLTADISLRNG